GRIRAVVRAEDGVEPAGALESVAHAFRRDRPALARNVAARAGATVDAHALEEEVVPVDESARGERARDAARVRREDGRASGNAPGVPSRVEGGAAERPLPRSGFLVGPSGEQREKRTRPRRSENGPLRVIHDLPPCWEDRKATGKDANSRLPAWYG